MNYVTKTTSELQVGDIVNCHGMRCLVEHAPRASRSHPVDLNVFWTVTKVINRGEVRREAVPYSYTLQADQSHRWTIQGNHLAHWAVEV